jgi:hypothetical protein
MSELDLGIAVNFALMNIVIGEQSQCRGFRNIVVGDGLVVRGDYNIVVNSEKVSLPKTLSSESKKNIIGLQKDILETYKVLNEKKQSPPGFYEKAELVINLIISLISLIPEAGPRGPEESRGPEEPETLRK